MSEINCSICQGSGSSNETTLTPCNSCNGTGVIQVGFIRAACLDCHGTGKKVNLETILPCSGCGGAGKIYVY